METTRRRRRHEPDAMRGRSLGRGRGLGGRPPGRSRRVLRTPQWTSVSGSPTETSAWPPVCSPGASPTDCSSGSYPSRFSLRERSDSLTASAWRTPCAKWGVDPVVADALSDLTRQSQQARWWLLLVGGWLVLWTGHLGAKALVLVHAAVWSVPPPPAVNPLWASLAFTGSVLATLASMAGVRWLRTQSTSVGVIATLALIVVPFALWFLISRWLPHKGSGWRELLPGACLVAVGFQALYLFTTWFLAPKLDSATQLYGLVGVVSTFLFWLYIIGRLMIGAATLNASLDEHRAARTTDQEA